MDIYLFKVFIYNYKLVLRSKDLFIVAVYIPVGKGYVIDDNILLTLVDIYGVLIASYIDMVSEGSGPYSLI